MIQKSNLYVPDGTTHFIAPGFNRGLVRRHKIYHRDGFQKKQVVTSDGGLRRHNHTRDRKDNSPDKE
ncbi:hypothetical protein [Rhodohalobacter sp. 8-1]|uniref:hypothetical protein n=1 Tax=Rhodohalobacter sp. 8-1 TaxID=3131972 RepID=UPI0030EDC52D